MAPKPSPSGQLCDSGRTVKPEGSAAAKPLYVVPPSLWAKSKNAAVFASYRGLSLKPQPDSKVDYFECVKQLDDGGHCGALVKNCSDGVASNLRQHDGAKKHSALQGVLNNDAGPQARPSCSQEAIVR